MNAATRIRPVGQPARSSGFGLVELMVAGLIGSVLVAGLVQAAIAMRGSFVLQESVAELQENARYTRDRLTSILGECGFSPHPWQHDARLSGSPLTGEDAVTSRSDRLTVRSLSDRNCFGALNPVPEATGRPAFHLRESVLERTASNNLVVTCRYGPDPHTLVTQIPRQGVMNGVEWFQALFAEDTDGDQLADRWVRGGAWNDEASVVGVRLGLLLASREPVGAPADQTLNLLDRSIVTPADGRLRRVVSVARSFGTRLP